MAFADWLEHNAKTHACIQHTGSTSKIQTHRVNQLDSIKLDEEISRILLDQCSTVLRYVVQPHILDQLKPEIEIMLASMLFKYSVWERKPSPGDLLQNLTYSKSPNRFLYYVAFVALPYIHLKISRYMVHHCWESYPDSSWQRRLSKLSRLVELILRYLSWANFLLFLHNGQFRTFQERILGLSSIYIHPRASRQVVFDFMNQQLEFLLFFIPLVNLDKLRRFLKRLCGLESPRSQLGAPSSVACAICSANPIVNTYTTQCGHEFCYYCISASCLAETRFRCPHCDEVVISHTRK